jgi:hypothetical protein
MISSFTFSVDCQWGKWIKNGQCSQSCGSGEQIVEREPKVEQQYNGADCLGNDTKVEPCFVNPCRKCYFI